MRTSLLIAAIVAAVALFAGAAWASMSADDLDRSATAAEQRTQQLRAQVAAAEAEQAAVERRSQRAVDGARAAAAGRDAIVDASGDVQRGLDGLARASLALTEAQIELTKVDNRVVDLLNESKRDEAGALLEGEARERQADVAAALRAERDAARKVRRAAQRYEKAAK